MPLYEWITDTLTQIINSKTPLCAARRLVNDYAFIELIKSVSNLQSWWYSENRTLFWSSCCLTRLHHVINIKNSIFTAVCLFCEFLCVWCCAHYSLAVVNECNKIIRSHSHRNCWIALHNLFLTSRNVHSLLLVLLLYVPVCRCPNILRYGTFAPTGGDYQTGSMCESHQN